MYKHTGSMTSLINKRAAFAAVFIFIFCIFFSSAPVAAKTETKFHNEEYEFEIRWKLLTVGAVTLKTTVDKKNHFLDTVSTIDSFSTLRNFYYVHGNLATRFDYKNLRTLSSFEKIYQGKTYKEYYYSFQPKGVYVNKIKKTYKEYSYPKKSAPKIKKSKKFVKNAADYQGLLGAFHYVRAVQSKPKVGDEYKIKVLPGGLRRYLVMRIIKKEVIETRNFGKREALLVKTGLSKYRPDKGKVKEKADLFFRTRSQIYMYISNDENRIPLKAWTTLPYLGDVEVHLKKYKKD